MPLDLGRVTHLLEQMHRSEDDAGDPIVINKVLVTDGAAGFTWEDYGGAPGEGLDSDLVRWLDLGLSGAAFTVDWSAAPSQKIELDDDTDATLTGIPALVDGETIEGRGRLWIETDGTFAITWPVTVSWSDGTEPDLTTAGLYYVDFATFDGGTTFYGFFGGGGGSALTIKDEGSDVDTATEVIDFVGSGVTVTSTGAGAVEVEITAGSSPADDTQVWMPLTTVDGGEPVLVWDGDDSLIPTLVPV